MADMHEPTTVAWLELASFLDAHANDMRAWTEDESKFRAAADGLRQLAAITAERDAAVARAAQLGTGIDSVRSHWHADEGPRWTANVIEALRHSGLMDDVMLSGTPDPDTNPNTLADRLDDLANDRRWDCWNQHGGGSLDVPEGYDPSPDCCDAADGANALRAAADGLRQLADENRALREREQGLLDAIAGQDPDQCAVCGDVYCSGAYCLKQMVAELPDEHQELPEPIEKVQDMVRLGRILSEWAAADRAVTDGEATDG